MKDPNVQPPVGQPNAVRRKIAKGTLAAPVILATLASKPVLAAAPWRCTISGQVSGNMSGHESETCDQLGRSPTYWQSNPWPDCDAFFTHCGDAGALTARLFKDTPHGMSIGLFADAFNNELNAAKATAVEVLEGKTTPTTAYATTRLGQEAVAALLNALQFGTAYPIPSADVITIFNAIATTGSYATEFGAVWHEPDVYNYFAMLHDA